MDKIKGASVPSNIVLMSRKKMSVSGVCRVAGFDDTQIEAETTAGLLLIRGRGLKIESYSEESLDLALEGEVDGLVYVNREQKKSFLSRLLK